MKQKLAVIVLAASSLVAGPASAFLGGLLGGGAENSQAGQAPGQAIPPALGDAAAKDGPFVTLADVGMREPKTLWIPARYTGAGRAQLYVNGRKFVAPGGHDNVLGFLPAPYGYFVAVHQPVGATVVPQAAGPAAPVLSAEQLAKMTPEQQIAALQLQLQIMQAQAQNQPQVAVVVPVATAGQPHVVYYRVSPAGGVLGVVADVQAGAKAWVTPDAIFVAQPAGRRAAGDGQVTVFNVVGYTPAGERVDGPQDALSATPGPDGEWYWYGMSGRSSRTEYRKIDRAGRVQALRSGETDNGYDAIINSQQAFVNLPPIADSIRTKRVMYVSWDSGRGALRTLPRGVLYVAPLDIGEFKDRAWLGGHREFDSLHSMAERAGLFGTPDRPLYAGQADGDSYKESGVNLYVLNAADPKKDYYALYNVMGRGMNIARSIFGDNNGGSFTLDSRNDLFVFVTPTTTVGVKARAGKDGVQGFDMLNRRALGAQEVQSFALRHGLTAD